MYKADPNDNTKMIPSGPNITEQFNKVTLPAAETKQEQPTSVVVNKSGYYAFIYPDYTATFNNITGFITASRGFSEMTGSNTLFTSELAVGDTLRISSGSPGGIQAVQSFTVKSITSDTILELNTAWTGGTWTGSVGSTNNLMVPGNGDLYVSGARVLDESGPVNLPIQPVAWRRTDGTSQGSVGEVTFIYTGVK